MQKKTFGWMLQKIVQVKQADKAYKRFRASTSSWGDVFTFLRYLPSDSRRANYAGRFICLTHVVPYGSLSTDVKAWVDRREKKMAAWAARVEKNQGPEVEGKKQGPDKAKKHGHSNFDRYVTDYNYVCFGVVSP